MKQSSRIYVAGGLTLAGAALREHLLALEYTNLVGTPPDEPDLNNAGQVEDFFSEAQPEYVFFAAGASGGIALNQTRPAELMVDNLLATIHVLQMAHLTGVRKLLFLGSSCSYPRAAAQPMEVESLMGGALEPTSAPYAMAKLAGWQLCQAFRQQYGSNFVTAIPANCFGPQDDFDLDSGHVIPALLRRAHEAKEANRPELVVWGSGSPRREFLFAEDLADACLFVMNHYDGSAPINLGGGPDLSILETAVAVAKVVGYSGRMRWDVSKPDGMPVKRLDCSTLAKLGWQPKVDFAAALMRTYEWFLANKANALETQIVS